GKLAREQILFADNLKTIERVRDHGLAFGTLNISVRERNVQVLSHGEIVQQVELLKDKANVFLMQSRALFRRKLMHRMVAQEIFTFPCMIVHAEDREQRR